MIIQCEQPFVSSLLNEKKPSIIYQNVVWDVLNVVPTDQFSEWNERIYDVEIEIRKDSQSYQQLSLF